MFLTGIIVPILKKSTLNPNTAENYRPIMLSSVHAKLIELFMIPEENISDAQFGFRKGRSASFGCAFLHDVISYHNSRYSPVYLCALDAQKCFDSIWHDGLLYKLMNVLPKVHWLLLYKWYSNSQALVRWNGDASRPFPVMRGVRQGSILSPYLFNIFIDDMLQAVNSQDNGLRIGNDSYSLIAYADDVTLISSTLPGLQNSINICNEYSRHWRFKFNPHKSKFIVMGPKLFSDPPRIYLDGEPMTISDDVNILGVNFNSKNTCKDHIEHRIQQCRRNYYSLGNSGLSYPGLDTEVKTHIWKSVCTPILTYGLETLSISNRSLSNLESTQGTFVKKYVGIGKRSHNTALLKALDIPRISDHVATKTLSLFNRCFKSQSPLTTLYAYLLSEYIVLGQRNKGSIIDRILNLGYSPVNVAFSDSRFRVPHYVPGDGTVDSLRYLVHHENFIKPWAEEHVLAVLLTRCF